MNTNYFKLVGLTRLGIKADSIAPEADTLTTRPSELLSAVDCSKSGVDNLLHLKSQTIARLLQYETPPGAAKLSSGSKTSVIPKMIPKKRSLFISKTRGNWGFQDPHVALRPQVADPCSRSGVNTEVSHL